MDSCLAVLSGFPPAAASAAPFDALLDEAFDMAMRVHMQRVNKLFKDVDTATLVANHATELLERLDPGVHTYSYLAVLDTTIPADPALFAAVAPVVAAKVVAFFVAFDPRQVRYIGAAFTHLFTAIGSGKIIPSSIAVQLLAHALHTLEPSGYMLTSNHLTLAKLAYHTNNAAAALPVLGKDIVYYPGMASSSYSSFASASSTYLGKPLCSFGLPPPAVISKDTGLTLPLNSSQVLEFDYIVGLLHLSVRDWAAANAAFAHVVSYPARDNGVSKIMVAAHRYWVLTGLLVYSKVAAAPPQTAAAVVRVCGTLNKPYVRISELFQDASVQGLQAEVALAAETLTADGTFSLVLEVVSAHPKWRIARLRNVYSTVSIRAIREVLQRPSKQGAGSSKGSSGSASGGQAEPMAITEADVTSLVESMIGDGMIQAVIHPGTAAMDTYGIGGSGSGGAYLEFLAEEQLTTEGEFSQRAREIETRIKALQPLHKTTNEYLSLHREYIRQYMRDLKAEKDGGEGGDAAAALPLFPAMGEPDLDEDLMIDAPGESYGI